MVNIGINDRVITDAIRDKNDEKALRLLYKKCFSKVRRFILRNNGTHEDARDIFKDAVLVLYHQTQKSSRNTSIEAGEVVYNTAKNLWINQIKRYSKEKAYEYSNRLSSGDPYMLNIVMNKEKRNAVKIIMQSMDERCRELLELSLFYGFSEEQIKEKLQLDEETDVSTAVYKCHQKLMEQVDKHKNLYDLLH